MAGLTLIVKVAGASDHASPSWTLNASSVEPFQSPFGWKVSRPASMSAWPIVSPSLTVLPSRSNVPLSGRLSMRYCSTESPQSGSLPESVTVVADASSLVVSPPAVAVGGARVRGER